MFATRNSVLTLAALLAAGLLLGACQTDDSRPTRPRTENPFGPNQDALDRAERRALEEPGRQVPTGAGSDAPRQLNQADPSSDSQVVTLQAGGAAGGGAPGALGDSGQAPAVNQGGWNWNNIGNTVGRTNTYTRGNYIGPLPQLPANPGSVPMVGATQVPGTAWSVDHSWGQGLVLQESAHRAWPESTGYYESGAIKHNPTYYYHLQPTLNMQQPDGSFRGDWVSNLVEIPWFYLNTAALPVLMILEPPLAQRTTDRLPQDPNYNGHLPAGGTVVPTPAPGDLRWTYPFLNPDGSVKDRPGQGTRPAPR